jgi:hypothetical protein
LPLSVASEIIRAKELAIQLTRRIEIINSFSAGRNGRAAMVFSLCRELAFATAHGIARWQETPNVPYHYHRSWYEFDSDDEQSGSDSGSEDD